MQLCGNGCHESLGGLKGRLEKTWKKDLLRATKLANHIRHGSLPRRAGVWVSTRGKYFLPVLVLVPS